jgi:pimeloyl-ACP methyl ester carboxylesterase
MDLLNNFAYHPQGLARSSEKYREELSQKWSAQLKFPRNPNSPEFSWLYRMQNNPGAAFKKLTMPVLIFLGEKDNFISPLPNAELAESLLAEAGNNDHKVVIVPGAEHNMFVHKRKKQRERLQVAQGFSSAQPTDAAMAGQTYNKS